MSRPVEDLGLLEQQVLLACLRLDPNGYGVAIGDEIKLRTGRDYSPGSFTPQSSDWKNKAMSKAGRAKPARSEGVALRYISPCRHSGGRPLKTLGGS